MKCIAADNSGNPFDVENGLGLALCKTGLIKQWAPPKPDVIHQMTWSINEFPSDGKPYIVGKCSACPDPLPAFGVLTRAPEFRHKTSNRIDACPDHVLADYNELLARFTPKPREPRREETFRAQL